MSLYNKYRPKTLKSIVGNKETISTIQKMLAENNCPHAILLHGETGCGKTTAARIIAQELGCIGSDYRETDVADFRGIDTIRDIRKECQYRPLESSVKMYVLDEAHRLTGDAQNALLKILEDTPSHVYFILCTTEPNKLINTLKGRCSQFQMNVLTDEQMLFLINRICKKENQKLSEKHIELIIEQAFGHPRNAIQILEQAFSVEEDKRGKMILRAAENQSASIELCRILLKGGNWKQVAEILKNLKDQEPESIRRQVLGYMQSVLLNKDTERAAMVMEEFLEPFYNTGYPGLVFACYSIIKS